MWKKVGAEFCGTAFMVGVGCGSIALGWSSFAVSFTFGLAVCIAIICFGPVSGAHINPAVTLGFWRSGHLDKGLVLPYIVAQISGGFIGSLLSGGAGPTTPANHIGLAELVGIEIFITLLLMLSILFIIRQTSSMFAIAVWVGGTVAFLAFFFGSFTGASMNPARTIGPNLLSNHSSVIMIYVISCCIGAILASEFGSLKKIEE